MAGRRAPGGGRKPQGEFTGKSAVFSTRIRPELRHDLERSARRNKRSLSQEVERRLSDSFVKPSGEPRNRALAAIIAELAGHVEASTQESWQENVFTFEALKSAIEAFIANLAPQGPVAIPPSIKKKMENPNSANFANKLSSPSEIGQSVALGLWTMMGMYERPSSTQAHVHYAEQFYSIPQWREGLGLKLKQGNN